MDIIASIPHQIIIPGAIPEYGDVKQYASHKLRESVRVVVAGVKRVGVCVRDRVADFAVVLATASIGAVFTSTATDMGISGILDRYRQIPKILSPSSKTVYAGKTINITKRIAGVESNFGLDGYGLEKAVMLRSEKIGDREKLTKEYCCF